jgi:hypothetical protein
MPKPNRLVRDVCLYATGAVVLFTFGLSGSPHAQADDASPYRVEFVRISVAGGGVQGDTVEGVDSLSAVGVHARLEFSEDYRFFSTLKPAPLPTAALLIWLMVP